MRNLLIFFAIMSAAITLSFCKTPLDEDEVPIEEWTVTKVEFWPSDTNPLFRIYFSGNTPDHDVIDAYSYYSDFDLTKRVHFDGILNIPNVLFTGAAASISSVTVYAAVGTTINSGTIATFYNEYFYQVESEAISQKVTAKIKIVTKSIPIDIRVLWSNGGRRIGRINKEK